MYYYIRGEYVDRKDNFVVVEAGGVGYKIYTSALNLEKMPPLGTQIIMYTHLYVREDMQDLYGFSTNEEISLFLQLISVTGVGPKAALSIMSVLSCEQFSLAVITNNTKEITKAQGVGQKVAQRIILELKDKIKTTDAMEGEIKTVTTEQENLRSEAVTALVVLGYTANEAKKAVGGIAGDLSVEDIVKQALKILMK